MMCVDELKLGDCFILWFVRQGSKIKQNEHAFTHKCSETPSRARLYFLERAKNFNCVAFLSGIRERF